MTDFPFLALFLVGLVIALAFSVPEERGRDLLCRALDRIHSYVERTNQRPLYLLPLAILEWLAVIIALLHLSPFIVIYYVRRRA